MAREVPHVHDESASTNTHAHTRFSGHIQTRNFRLSRTTGTGTRFKLLDRRTAAEIEFDYAWVGSELGRGDTAQFYVGEPNLDERSPYLPCTKVGSWYQHDLDDGVLECLEGIQQHQELPRPDSVLEPDDARKVLDDEESEGTDDGC